MAGIMWGAKSGVQFSLSLIALKLAQVRRSLPEDEIEFILEELYDLPAKMEQFLDGDHPIEEIAERHCLSQRGFDEVDVIHVGGCAGLSRRPRTPGTCPPSRSRRWANRQ